MFLRATLTAAAIITAAIGSASPALARAARGATSPHQATVCRTQHPVRGPPARPQYAWMATTRAVNTRTPVAHATATAAFSSTCNNRWRLRTCDASSSHGAEHSPGR